MTSGASSSASSNRPLPTRLYHFWSAPEAQRIRLALSCKGVGFEDHPLAYDDDETFFVLGVARQVPILQLPTGELRSDSLDILWCIDRLFPDAPHLVDGRIDADDWQALTAWRLRAEPILERLYACVHPAYRDVCASPETLAAYKAEVRHRFGMSVEALANDRYAGYAQLDAVMGLRALARYLGRGRFYAGPSISIADMLLAADLHPLQLLDGISLPIDLLYYLERVEQTSRASLRDGWSAPF